MTVDGFYVFTIVDFPSSVNGKDDGKGDGEVNGKESVAYSVQDAYNDKWIS